MTVTDQVVVRFYTQARKIPYMLGKIGDIRLWGGPYTLTQGVVAFVVAWIGQATMPMWAGGMITIVAWIPVMLAAIVCGYVAGRIPFKGRNPLMLLWGLIGYASAPSWGSQAGVRMRLGPSHKIRSRFSSPSMLKHAPAPVDEVDELDEESLVELLGGELPAIRESDVPQPEEEQFSGPSLHQLTEVQQILAASAQRR
ncbi:MAG: hypothetical protein ACTH2X_00785 [Brachybacterium tyrofermentans]